MLTTTVWPLQLFSGNMECWRRQFFITTKVSDTYSEMSIIIFVVVFYNLLCSKLAPTGHLLLGVDSSYLHPVRPEVTPTFSVSVFITSEENLLSAVFGRSREVAVRHINEICFVKSDIR